MKELFSIAVLVIFLYSCQKKKDDAPQQIACTASFAMIGVTISGDSLTEHYTIRPSISDTIRFQQEYSPYPNWYKILDDNYHSKITNIQDSFRFIGFINDSIVVNESYIIKGDVCHIGLVSGKTEVQL